jgi:hypothetical protein
MVTSRGVILIGAVLALAAVGCWEKERDPDPDTGQLPLDFYARSEFHGASVAPPHHYNYRVVLSRATTDTIVFKPGYDFDDPPVWTETFAVSEKGLQDLYSLMSTYNLFRDSWDVMDPPPVGGDFRRLRVTAHARSYDVPAHVIDVAAVNPVYTKIDDLVPPAVWDSLWARRERYIRDY